MIGQKIKNDKKFLKIYKIITFFCIFCVIFAIFYIIFQKTDIWNKINSVEKIRNIVEKGGVLSFLIFMLIQILQTTILQIPSFFVTLVGTMIFGPIPSFFMSFASIMIGSILMFIFGRKLGRKFLYWFIGKKKSDKWIELLSKGKYLFFLMMMFPFFPDDILCAVAGVTDMSFKFFFWTNFISRGVGIFSVVFFGSGKVIPFTGWGIIIWILIVIFMLVLFYLSVKKKEEIDLFLLRKK